MSSAGDVPTAGTFDLSINPNGAIALRSATQSITTGGAGTLVTFDGEEFDNSSMFTPSSTNITVQTDGLYDVACYVEWQANATSYRGVDLFVNGVSIGGMTTAIGTAAATTRMTASSPALLTAGDVVTVSVIQASGSTLTITARASVIRKTGN